MSKNDQRNHKRFFTNFLVEFQLLNLNSYNQGKVVIICQQFVQESTMKICHILYISVFVGQIKSQIVSSVQTGLINGRVDDVVKFGIL